MKKIFITSLLLLICGSAIPGRAQFTSNLQGMATDTSGAVIPDAKVVLTNTDTGVSHETTTGERGQFRFVSLAPGPYEVTVSATGFATYKLAIKLLTEQTMDLPITLGIASQAQTVEVSDRTPVLDTADSRTQLTIDKEALDALPLPGHDLLSLTTLAPGVTGLGMLGTGQNGQSNDNYAAETQVTASANGRSSVGNMYVIDGLDITSNITPGVLNLVPNPDTVEEATVQVNTFNVDYGRSSSIVEVMTTKGGGNRYHFLASNYFTNQNLQASTEFVHSYAPFHSNNISTTLSGPVPRLHETYFFTGFEPLLSLTATGNTVYTFEAPQFTQWAQASFPNTLGTKLLTQYPAGNATVTGVAKTAAQLFPTTCGKAATANLPCSTPVFDTGIFNASNYRNALQYNIRLDKYFTNDRVYANYYQTSLETGGPALRMDMQAPAQYSVRSIQTNETHTFSSYTINEAAFGFLRMEGLLHKTGPFHVPIVSVTGWSANIGVNQAHEDYVQHHAVWHEVLTRVYKSHELKFGYEGFHGDNLTYFGPWFSQPNFSFTSMLNLVEDSPYSESGVAYNLLTGQPAGSSGGSYQFTGNTTGLYAQDTWKASRKLTLNYGLRWDDFGNPSPENNSIEANFFLGPGTTIPQQVANGYVKQVPHALNHAITAFSPRIGAAWDVTGRGNWVLHGGFGLYHDWLTLGNVQNEFGNPPAPVTETFLTGTTTAPVFLAGTSDVFPYGFTYPAIPTSGLNDHGGIVGLQSSIAGNDPNLKATNTLNYAVSLERALGRNFSVAAGYSGSHSNNLFTDFGGHTTNAYYGYDINNFPGSLIQSGGKLVRLNSNFGTIRYTENGPTSTYNAFIAEFKGRFWGTRGFVNMSYTRSSSWDDAGTYPTVPSNSGDFGQYWAPSNWDVPNRVSMAWSYEIPGLRRGFMPVHIFTNGWKFSSVTVLQSGTPYTVYTSAAFAPVLNSSGQVVGNTGGDYNGDGNNYDFPNLPSTGYTTSTSRRAYLNGVFSAAAFGVPIFGTEGNEEVNRFRNPGYANTDFALLKNNHIGERANLQLRFEFYNLFNRPNLGGVNANLASATFGKVSSQYNSRFLQLGARFEF